MTPSDSQGESAVIPDAPRWLPGWQHAAALLTLGSVLMYGLGQMFWTVYLSRFGLDVTVARFDFYSILSTTWMPVALIVIVLLMPFTVVRAGRSGVIAGDFMWRVIVGALFLLLFPWLMQLPMWAMFAGMAVMLCVMVALTRKVDRLEVDLGRWRNGRSAVLTVMTGIALVALNYFGLASVSSFSMLNANSGCVALLLQGDTVARRVSVVVRTNASWIVIDRTVSEPKRMGLVLQDAAVIKAQAVPCVAKVAPAGSK
jgi:hypothetical protein